MSHKSMSGVLLVFLFWAVAGMAQVTTGTISGTVADSTGAVLPGATVVVLNEDTGIARSVTTDGAGRYSAPSLSLGRYRVTVSQQGFQTEVRSGIELTVGRQAVVDFQLSVGAITQTVEVTGEAPLVETQQSSVSYLVDDKTIRNLPLNGRDLTTLILLNPGVSMAENSATKQAYVGFGKKISIGGMRGEDNAYLLDGGYINDMNRHLPAGPGGSLMGAETVKEFQVLTNSYSAQYGRALGGVFNAVSKSGANEWHGSVYEFLRNSALDARQFFDRQVNPSDPSIPPFRRNQFGASLGGSLIQDKAFFFAAYEGLRESSGSTNYLNVPDENARQGILPSRVAQGLPPIQIADVIAPYLARFPLPTPGGRNFGDGTAQFIFPYTQPAMDDFGQGRVDYQLSDSDSLFGRFTASNATRDELESYPGYHTFRILKTRLLTLSETRIVSTTFLNTLRFSFNRVDPVDQGVYPVIDPKLLSAPGVPPPDITPGSGVSGMTGAPKPLDRWVTNRFNYQDDVNWTLRGHSLQFGGMAERMQFNMDQPDRPQGAWGFRTLETFLQGVPNSYRGTPPQLGSSVRGFRQWFLGLYLQDDWKLTSRLTLNLGLRWEPYTVPKEVNNLIANLRHIADPEETLGDPYWRNKSWGDLGPRFGFAWSPFGTEKTSVRGGVGLFFLPNDPTIYRTPATRSKLFPNIQITNPRFFPSSLAAIAAATVTQAPEAIPFENLKSSRAVQYNLSVQQQLGSSSVVTVGYTGSRGINQTCYCEYNKPLATFNGVSLEVPTTAKRIYPQYDSINYYTNGANSWYNGLAVSLQRRFAEGFQLKVAYTYSQSLSQADSTSKTDSSGGGGGSPRYAHDLRTAKGYSGYHLANVFSTNYVYDLPLGRGWTGIQGHLFSGWQLSGIISLQSGQPFNVSSSAPANLSDIGVGQTVNLDNQFTRGEIIQGGPDQYFNPFAFYRPGPWELGNLGKNFLIGPGLAKWDFSLKKETPLTEQWRLEFRAEFFNLLNRANFSNPAASLFAANGNRQGNAGVITDTVTTGRQIQFGLRLSF